MGGCADSPIAPPVYATIRATADVAFTRVALPLESLALPPYAGVRGASRPHPVSMPISASISPAPADRSARLNRLLREGWRYGLISAVALAADTTAYGLGLQLGLPLALAIALGFVVGLGVAYAGSVLWVFEQHRLSDRRAEFAGFAGIGLLGLLLTQAALWWLVSLRQWPPIPAKLLTAIGVFVFNFSLRRLMLFTRPASSQPA